MADDKFAKTLVDIGERLDRSGRAATCGGYSASELLRELDIELVPTLPGAPPTTPVTGIGPVEDDADAAPNAMGRFSIEKLLGKGGMGRVYEARDPELRRSVAVKCYVDPEHATGHHLSRFVAEAQITAQLEHPNIVPVYDMGVTLDGQLYIVMRRVVGRSLREVVHLLADGDPEALREWTSHKLLAAFVQVCHAVAYAHDRGVVHRDLKPSNIMLGAFGEVLVMDWGIAKIVDPGSSEPIDHIEVRRTECGRPVGTPGYMSPEQLLGQPEAIDARSDVWSLGAILYELVTHEKAFSGREGDVTERVLTGSVVDPRERAPDRSVPVDLVEVILTALDPEPTRRFANAAALASAVEAHLEGSRKRAAAEEHALEALALLHEYEALGKEQEYLAARRERLARQIPSWAALDEKAELLEADERLVDLETQRAELFAEVVLGGEHALEAEPTNAEARRLLAQAYATRLVVAEAEDDLASQRFFESRVRAYDDGALETFLEGTGALTLRTSPSGAEVSCRRVERRGLVWTLGPAESLGRTPLVDVPLPMGSALLTLRAAGFRDTTYPVLITRGHRWSTGDRPLRLFSDEEIGEGWIYVPPGPFVKGGDGWAPGSLDREEFWVTGFFVRELPVTMAEYCDFVNALHLDDPDEAFARVPRVAASPVEGSWQYWKQPPPGERYVVPDVDVDGECIDPRWPVVAVSWHDAIAYARWRAREDELPLVVIPELWWEKAARGVDGRRFPWGDGFDPSLCKMHGSRPGRPRLEQVGAFPTDVSVYGVRDIAGSVREWCGDSSFDEVRELRPVRGGSWEDQPMTCRLAHRRGLESWTVKAQVGFRLARPSEPDRSTELFEAQRERT